MATTPNGDENDWQRRLSHRLAGVRSVKTSSDYAACCARPPTPDPYDRTVTKRRWERSIQEFRQALRGEVLRQSAASAPERTERSSAAVSFLCGCWQDQRGSIYKITPGCDNAFHVETMRPKGHCHYTQDLVCIATIDGRETTTWGSCRYELERRGSSGLLWHGASKHDVFLWQRVEDS